ncbi:MAG: L,D-transpeptidase family protein [Hyphomicrobium sp.]
MRSVVCAVAAFAAVMGWAVPLTAAPAGTATDGAVAAGEATDDEQAAVAAIIADVESRMEAARDPIEKGHLSQLSGHYREQGVGPHWTSAHGLTDAGRALYDELAEADLYGLDPTQFRLPDLPISTASVAARAAAEVDLSVSAVRYAWHARGGRVDATQLSRWLDASPRTVYAGDVFRAIAANGGDVVAGLRSFHPQHPQFERLRLAYLEERGDIARKPLPLLSPGERIDAGKRHPDVQIIRQRLGAEVSEDADLLDRTLMRKIRTYLDNAGYESKRYVDDGVREALNRAAPPARIANRDKLEKFLVNLERWRTMPADMGKLYVWNNLPEFQTRVVKSGEVIHQERIIIGKPNTQTPVFSDEMNHVIFQPEWGVPESIKLRQILPLMRGGDYGVLARRGMQIRDGKRVINPARIKWSKVDIRNVPIIQGPGPGNPLGRLKFMFPNHHDVYMHDTNDKYLFNDTERTFSHGCIRVRNPERFAEVILGEVEGWSAEDVARQLKVKSTARIELKTHLPVYNTYLTTWVNPDGTLVQFKDIYGHDKRYSDALAGKSIKLIASRDPALALKKQNDELRKGGEIATLRPKPRPAFAAYGAPQPWFKSSFGKPQKYYSAAPPPRLLYFQQY